MEIPLLKDIVVIFGLAMVVLLLCHRLRIPAIVGYLLTGIVAGPHGLGLIQAEHEVEVLAEIGIVLLLFTIGIEFSLEKLFQLKKSVLLGGSLQVGLTILAVYAIAGGVGLPAGEAVFFGFLISLSSTAIVLKLIQERAEIDSPHGRTSLSILIFQDIIIVPMILFTPLLAGVTGKSGSEFVFLAIKGMGIIGLVMVSAKWIVPRLLYQITRTRSRELFSLTIAALCLATAWLTSSAGLSLALGAFLAGLIISESEYSHHALGNILPFRDVFTSFFFVSIGMLLDADFLFQHLPSTVLITAGIIILKTIIACLAALFLGFPLRTAVLVGLALCQVGEFSFILSKTGAEHGLLNGGYQLFLTASVLTMAATPFIMALAPKISEIVNRFPLPNKLLAGMASFTEATDTNLKNHLLIIGFGVNGRNVARTAKVAGVPYVVIEMSPDTVKNEKAAGEPIFYGDATHEAVLEHANIKDAKIAVLAINDPAATRRIVANTKKMNHNVHLIVRTRYIQEMRDLYELGADEVIPEEFETSVEIFTRVLTKYLIPKDDIEKLVAKVRSDGYEMFRSLSLKSSALSNLKLHLPDIEIMTFRISSRSTVVGKNLAQTQLRNKFGVTVLGIRRNSQIFPNPSKDIPFCADDELYVMGRPENLVEVGNLFMNSE